MFAFGAWAGLYLWLDALPDWHEAMLYSLGAVTSYGHAPIFLADRWRLLGAIEAVDGLILFGLTTAAKASTKSGGSRGPRKRNR